MMQFRRGDMWTGAVSRSGRSAAEPWPLPERFNMGVACSDCHEPATLAVVDLDGRGIRREFTFGELSSTSNQLGNRLRRAGLYIGDKVSIILPQCVETAIAHLATYKIGAVAVPISHLLDDEQVCQRVMDSGTRAVVTDTRHAGLVAALEGIDVLVVDGPASDDRDFWSAVRSSSPLLEAADTTPDSPAALLYTSGTTGRPKAALHGHRVLLGHLPGFEMAHNGFPRADDIFWTPADWAWIGGLLDALLPVLYHGRTIVATRGPFDPDDAVRIMASEKVRNVFLPPRELQLMRAAGVDSPMVNLRTMMSGGEHLPPDLVQWANQSFGTSVNEIYGQTEANYIVGNSEVWAKRAGSMGRAYPGHEVEILDGDGLPISVGQVGEIAVRSTSPVVFMQYWGQPEATRNKFTPNREWLLTGDLAIRDGDGYFWYASRHDDVIEVDRYRISPSEIEACIASHPAVRSAAVVGVPGESSHPAIVAYAVLSPGVAPGPAVEAEILRLVNENYPARVSPAGIEFVPALPMTDTGKIRRRELRDRLAAGRDGRNAAVPQQNHPSINP
ncbi:AMP-binding protein [Arthrobacter sp. NPDC058127]|uniref:AMP-binding protein n=1 Tax=Arthrobacter sp. NPDC058127 TaxID=3346351 RepID=UPI0036E79363